MKRLTKIIINIDKKNQNYPVVISYEGKNGIQNSFQLDTETTESAYNFFQILRKNSIIITNKYKLYCHDFKNKKINLYQDITDNNTHYLASCDLNSVERLIQKIKYTANKKDHLIPLYVNINNKTFFLNEQIIKIKKNIPENEVIDLETYLLFLEELRPGAIAKMQNSSKNNPKPN